MSITTHPPVVLEPESQLAGMLQGIKVDGG
jgi:hypothetical protein